MFQGPNIPAANMNEQFTHHMRKIQEGETLQTGETQRNNNGRPCLRVTRETATSEQQEIAQMLCYSDESTQITVAENQVTHLHQFIHNWKKQSYPNRELSITEEAQSEPLFEQREHRAIREFKREGERDLLNYLNQKGLQRRNIQS